ncbi:MAG TPA: glycosyltransferase family 39 protein, partial [Roseiflexaceae bacterium]|nr:glycosyltransferase family 39 protein [Roseiflexaceae bacterium]
QSLWLDEGGTWAEVTGRTGKGWLAALAELWSPDAGYPLYHLLLRLWVQVAGDSEWALRFPSALSGALAVAVLMLVIREVGRLQGHAVRMWPVGVLAGLAPFALWHAQDAKAYSLLFLAVATLTWCALRTLRQGGRWWLILFGVALVSLLVHRLALLAIAGLALGLFAELAFARQNTRRRPWWLLVVAFGCAGAGLAGTLRAAAAERAFIGREGVTPVASLGLTLVRFALDRWPGDVAGYLGLPLLVWLLPTLALAGWGAVCLAHDMQRRQPGAFLLACALALPLVLVAVLAALAPIYEARYAMVAFPAWLLVLAYPTTELERLARRRHAAGVAGAAVLFAVLLADLLTLLQPAKGLYSGAALKEQWRAAVAYLAQHEQPDDLVLIHPYYVALMYDYYAPRVTPDPLPQPHTFPVFAEGDLCGTADPTPAQARACWERRYQPYFNQQALGKKRALLLIAPDHARTVDPPKTLAELQAETPPSQPLPTSGDRYGWVGLRFQYPQKTWPCGGTGDALIGVEVMCQSFPETYAAGGPGTVPQPQTPLQAVFGGELELRGYTILPHGGALRPGGTLPITLYWQALQTPGANYRMFLHLCRDCDRPPLANDDAAPLAGYPPAGETTTWNVGDPVHDERTLLLPPDLAPGRYTLLLGVYPADRPTQEARLSINSSAETLSANRLVLGVVEISAGG